MHSCSRFQRNTMLAAKHILTGPKGRQEYWPYTALCLLILHVNRMICRTQRLTFFLQDQGVDCSPICNSRMHSCSLYPLMAKDFPLGNGVLQNRTGKYRPENTLTMQLLYPGSGWVAWSTHQYQYRRFLRTTMLWSYKDTIRLRGSISD